MMRRALLAFRIEFATVFTPHDGPLGRVDDACFAGRENPFARPVCQAVVDPCAGGGCPPPRECLPLGVKLLKLLPAASGAVVLRGTLSPPASLAPDADDVVVTLVDDASTLWAGTLAHPDVGPFWSRKGRKIRFKDPVGNYDGITKRSGLRCAP